MSKKKSGAKREKIKIIVLSVILAVVAWAFITWVDNPDITTKLSDIGVRFIGETELRAKGLVITGKTNIPEMSATISGKRRDLMEYMDGIKIDVDTSQITEAGEYSLTGALSLPSSRLSVEKENYGEIPITVEKLTEKEIEIKVKQTGTLKNKLVESVITEPKVKISGSKREIDTVAYGVATVDISDIAEGMPEKSGYVLVDGNGNLITKNETIETNTLSVDIWHTVYDLKNLPVEAELSDELAAQYTIKDITVTPSRADVGMLAGKDDAVVKAVVSNIGSDGNMEGRLVASDGMYIPEENKTVKIKAEVDKIVTKPIELNVEAQNAPDGKHVSIEHVTVTLSGEESKLNTDNIKASVDLNGMGSGTHSVRVNITGEGINVPDNCYTNVTIE